MLEAVKGADVFRGPMMASTFGRWNAAGIGLALVAGADLMDIGPILVFEGLNGLIATALTLVGAYLLYLAATGARDAPEPAAVRRLAIAFSFLGFVAVLGFLAFAALFLAGGALLLHWAALAQVTLLTIGYVGVAFQARQWTEETPAEARRRVWRIRVFAAFILMAEATLFARSDSMEAWGALGWSTTILSLVGWALFVMKFQPFHEPPSGVTVSAA